MPSYASRIRPEDRWAIVAYIRALQRSQNAAGGDLPESELLRIERERGVYEVKARNSQGRRVELYVDPKTGDVLR